MELEVKSSVARSPKPGNEILRLPTQGAGLGCKTVGKGLGSRISVKNPGRWLPGGYLIHIGKMGLYEVYIILLQEYPPHDYEGE